MQALAHRQAVQAGGELGDAAHPLPVLAGALPIDSIVIPVICGEGIIPIEYAMHRHAAHVAADVALRPASDQAMLTQPPGAGAATHLPDQEMPDQEIPVTTLAATGAHVTGPVVTSHV
jgi:hypothetical protein